MYRSVVAKFLDRLVGSSSDDVGEHGSPLETAVSSKKSMNFDCTDDREEGTVVPVKPRGEKRKVGVEPVTSA